MKSKSWIVPALFFVVAACANFAGRLGVEDLASMVKPALLPLLALTSVAYAGGMEDRTVKLLVLAQLFGCVGDILLIGNGFGFFVSGMAAFLVGHVCYIFIFGSRSWKGLGVGSWLIALAVMCAVLSGLVVAIGIKGALLAPMAIYGMALMLLIYSGLCGVVRLKDKAWWLILCGGVLFTFSDALIATDSFSVIPFAGKGFVIMLTYLAAQALLAAGTLRLVSKQ